MRALAISLLVACGGKHPDSGSPDPGRHNHDDTGGHHDDSADTHDSVGDTAHATGDSGPPPEPVSYLGRLAAHITYSGSLGTYDDDCNGPIDFVLEPDGSFAGTGACTAFTVDFDFAIDGTSDAGHATGNLTMDVKGDPVATPFDGTFDGADHFHAVYDATHANAGDTVRIAGSLDADPG